MEGLGIGRVCRLHNGKQTGVLWKPCLTHKIWMKLKSNVAGRVGEWRDDSHVLGSHLTAAIWDAWGRETGIIRNQW